MTTTDRAGAPPVRTHKADRTPMLMMLSEML